MKNLLYFLYLIVITVVLLEVILRFMVTEDDYTVSFRNNTISYKEAYWQEKVDYLLKPDPSNIHYGQYDPSLGWSIGANKFGDSLYTSNSQGIRAMREYTLEPDSGVFRIATFGDSFTHGYEVPDGETWEEYLEEMLQQEGINAEVINFGVGGYGMGQAYLRYQEMGRDFNPHLVIFGMQMENFWRTLNTCRAQYYRGTGIVLTKPRGYLENGELKWANRPTVAPENLLEVLLHFEESDLYPYEEFKEKVMYRGDAWFSWSYTYLLAVNVWEKAVTSQKEAAYRTIAKHEEGRELIGHIVNSFANEVKEAGADFMVVKLPMREHVAYYRENGEVQDNEYISSITSDFPVVYADSAFAEQVDNETFLAVHYSAQGNKTVAELLSEYLIESYPGLPQKTMETP
jgi:hypothetical protein